jgi:hypothetical protein
MKMSQEEYEQLILQRGRYTLSALQRELDGLHKSPQCISDTYRYYSQLQRVLHSLETLTSFDATGTLQIDESSFPLYLERLIAVAVRLHAHIQLQADQQLTQQCVAGELLLPWSAEAATVRGGLS